MPHARLPVFEKFIGDLRAVWSAETDDARRMDKARPLVEAFVKDPDLKAHSAQWPSTEGRKNLLLYVDPTYNFVVNAVVRMPGRTGSVHDHANAWVLYGVLDGTERLERYDRVLDGSRPGHAEVRLTSVTTGTQGKVDLVPPHAIHAEQGGPTRSGCHHRTQPTAWRGDRAAAYVRSQDEHRRRAIRPDADSLRPSGVRKRCT